MATLKDIIRLAGIDESNASDWRDLRDRIKELPKLISDIKSYVKSSGGEASSAMASPMRRFEAAVDDITEAMKYIGKRMG